MALSLRRGTITAIVERLEGLARIEVDGTPCVSYPRLTGAVALGDEVIVNVQARELELGSGGFDVLYANLTRGLDLPADPEAHVMKLPYTPLQAAAAVSALVASTVPKPDPSVRSPGGWYTVLVVSALVTCAGFRVGNLARMSATMPATTMSCSTN